LLKFDEKKVRKGRPLGLPYVGSKRKISKKIVELIKQNYGTDKTVYDLFGGGGAVTLECMINGIDVVYNDINDLPMRAIKKIASEDFEFLKTLLTPRDEFMELRNKENIDEIEYLRLVVNSFGYNQTQYLYAMEHSEIKNKIAKDYIERFNTAKGYRVWNKSRNDYTRIRQLERLADLERLQQKLKHIDLNNLKIFDEDYAYFSDVENSIIYLDPPYKNTVSRAYKNIDYERFTEWAKMMSEKNIVIVSEYTQPSDDFECIFEFKNAYSSMQGGQKRVNGNYERLWTINGK
jgi:site-specific DNA-adenine methylase